MSLTEALPLLTARQRAIYWGVVLFCAATRFLAMARSMWDWDEALLCLGMRSYDVSNHHPHPPGFPLYIAMGKIARLFIASDFRALQAINLIAGMLLFPAVFMLARELRLRFTTSVVAGALCAFFPNIWFFGGTAFSDVVSITLVVFAVAFLFRGCRDGNSYLIGVFLLALSVGIRPQNVLVGIFPALLATRYRARQSLRDIGFAALVFTAVVGVTYAGGIHATGSLEQYLSTVRAHGEYITRIDSFRSPERPPLWRLIDRFFVKQYQSPVLSIITSALVLLSIAGAIRTRDRSMLYNALTFGPFAISAWLMLDRYSISRFAIGYAPMFAIFAADGIARLCHPSLTGVLPKLSSAGFQPAGAQAPSLRRQGAGGPAARLAALLLFRQHALTLGVTKRDLAEVLIGALLTGAFLIWTLPALTPARNEIAPSVLGVDAVRQHLDRRRDELFVAFPMSPFIDYLLPNYPYRRVFDERALPVSTTPRRPYLLTEIEHTQPDGYVFRRQRGRLWNIARRHYFEVALQPLKQLPEFVSGWYGPERAGVEEWRWMSARSVTILPPSNVTTRLRLQFDVPDELVPARPTITILLNGAVIDRFRASEAHLARDYDVTPAASTNRLELSIDRTLNGGIDPRELGLLVRAISWGPL